LTPRMGILGPMRTAGRRVGAVAAAAALLLATGCGSAQPGASSVATRFVEALDADDAGAACGFLAPATKSELEKSAGKPCPAALTEEDLPSAGPVEKTEAFGTMAQVRFAEDTMFLAEFQGGWKVMAAGCSPEPGHPYDCRLQGG
jgi:hypothetical protein